MSAESELDRLLRAEAEEVDRRLDEHFQGHPGPSPRLEEAMRYSLLAGGKRLRPVLCLWTSDSLGSSRTDAVWNAALALEMLHTYSLIHDDLPAMDDDDLRRGRPSCHRRFDEATAILAGDALQTEAFSLLAQIDDAALARRCILRLSGAAGRFGMAGGQQWDLDHTGGPPAEAAPRVDSPARGEIPSLRADSGKESAPALEERLTRIHRLKTGALIGASFALGAACAGADPAAIDRIEEAGRLLGIAFQIVDDLLDESARSEDLGKTVGKDRQQGKLTAPVVLGADESRRRAARLHEEASSVLEELGASSRRLEALCRRLVDRER